MQHVFYSRGINSEPPKLAKALVRTFKLLLQGFDVKLIGAAGQCGRLHSQALSFELSFERMQIRLRQVSRISAQDRSVSSTRG